MKTTKLLKILASLAVVVSVASCGGGKKKTGELVSITQAGAVEFDSETNTFVAAKEGVLVTIKEEVMFEGEIGNGRIMTGCLTPNAQGSFSLADQYGIEVELAKGVKLVKGDRKTALAYTDHIQLTGTPTLENGRVVLKGATYEFVSDGDGKNVYWPADRDYFDYMAGDPRKSGLLMNGVFQIASIPTTYDAAKGATIKVVFPGEKSTDTADNDFLVDVAIPAGLTNDEFKKYTDTFAGAKSGDGFTMTMITRYDGGMGGVIPAFFLDKKFSSGEAWFSASELEGVYTDFNDVLDEMSDWANADLFAEYEAPNAYSYLLDTSNATTDYSDQSYCYVTADYDTIGRIDMKAYTDDPVADIEAILTNVTENTVFDADENELEWFLAAAWDANDGTPADYEDIVEVILLLTDVEPEEEPETSEESLLPTSEEESILPSEEESIPASEEPVSEEESLLPSEEPASEEAPVSEEESALPSEEPVSEEAPISEEAPVSEEESLLPSEEPVSEEAPVSEESLESLLPGSEPEAKFDGSEVASEEEPEEMYYAEVIIDVYDGYLSYVILTELTLPVEGEYEAFADAKAVYDDMYAAAGLTGQSALFPCFENAKALAYGIYWGAWADYASLGVYHGQVWLYIANEDVNTVYGEVMTAFVNGGAVPATSKAFGYTSNGYINETTKEFVWAIGAYASGIDGVACLYFYVDLYTSTAYYELVPANAAVVTNYTANAIA